jgi:hypothetical protein
MNNPIASHNKIGANLTDVEASVKSSLIERGYIFIFVAGVCGVDLCAAERETAACFYEA